MLDSKSFTSLEQLHELLKSLNERLTFIEKFVLPSRVTKEELFSSTSEIRIASIADTGRLRRDLDLLREQMATKQELEKFRRELPKGRAAEKRVNRIAE